MPFPFDPVMPHLPSALDAAVVLPLLRDRILAPGGDAGSIDECRVARIRYRPEERCLLQYVITTTQRRGRVTSTRTYFATGTLFGDPKQAARRASRQPGAHFLPELGMVVSVFPNDPKLPHARALLSGADPHLRAAVLQAFGAGEWTLERCDADVVRYREGLSVVARLSVTARNRPDGAAHRRVFYAKAYPDIAEARHALAHLTKMSRLAASSARGPRIDAPLGCIEPLATVLLPAAVGRPLDALLTDATGDEAVAAVARSARALADVHAWSAGGLPVYDMAAYVKSLRRSVSILEWATPGLAPQLREIVDRVSRLPAVEYAPTHRDMKPEHMMIDGDDVSLIDLDSSAAADPMLDVALMLARFETLALNEAQRPRIASLAAAFERAYLLAAPGCRRDRLPVLMAASLVEAAAGLFHRQVAGWQQQVPALIRIADAAIAGGTSRRS